MALRFLKISFAAQFNSSGDKGSLALHQPAFDVKFFIFYVLTILAFRTRYISLIIFTIQGWIPWLIRALGIKFCFNIRRLCEVYKSEADSNRYSVAFWINRFMTRRWSNVDKPFLNPVCLGVRSNSRIPLRYYIPSSYLFLEWQVRSRRNNCNLRNDPFSEHWDRAWL